MEFVPYLGPQVQPQLGARSSLCLGVLVVNFVPVSGPRELDPAPFRATMADVPLAHRTARSELDSIYEARVGRAGRAEHVRSQLERRRRELLPYVGSCLQTEHQPWPEM